MGYELNKLMSRYGVATPGMVGYTGPTAPVGDAPLAPTAPTLPENATRAQQNAYNQDLEAYNAAQSTYAADKAAFDETMRKYQLGQKEYNQYRQDYQNRLGSVPMYSDPQFTSAFRPSDVAKAPSYTSTLAAPTYGAVPASLGAKSEQEKVDYYKRLRDLGYTDADIRGSTTKTFGAINEGDWRNLMNKAFPQYQSGIESAYSNIGRSGYGSSIANIDDAGYNYWLNQVSSGKIKPEDLTGAIYKAANTWMPDTEYDKTALPEKFDWAYYVNKYPDLYKAGIDTLQEAQRHYALYGAGEERSPYEGWTAPKKTTMPIAPGTEDDIKGRKRRFDGSDFRGRFGDLGNIRTNLRDRKGRSRNTNAEILPDTRLPVADNTVINAPIFQPGYTGTDFPETIAAELTGDYTGREPVYNTPVYANVDVPQMPIQLPVYDSPAVQVTGDYFDREPMYKLPFYQQETLQEPAYSGIDLPQMPTIAPVQESPAVQVTGDYFDREPMYTMPAPEQQPIAQPAYSGIDLPQMPVAMPAPEQQPVAMPAYEEPAVNVSGDYFDREPMYAQPFYTNPIYTSPFYTQPEYATPVYTQPAVEVVGDYVDREPIYGGGSRFFDEGNYLLAKKGGSVHNLAKKYRVGGAVRKFRLGGDEGEPDVQTFPVAPQTEMRGVDLPPEDAIGDVIRARSMQPPPAQPVTASPAAKPVTPPPAATTPVSPAATDLMSMIQRYSGQSTYAPELAAARKRVSAENAAFSDMIAKAMKPDTEPVSKAELYFRLAAAFGAPTKTGQFMESVAGVSKELADYSKEQRATKKAEKQLGLQLGIEAQKLKTQAARDELTTLRTLAGEEMKDQREVLKEYIKSGMPQSEAGKAAKDMGLTPGSKEYNDYVKQYVERKLDSGELYKQAMLAISQGQLALAQSREGRARDQAAKLTPGEMRLKTDTEDRLLTINNALTDLERAFDLNPTTFDSSLKDQAVLFALEQTGNKDPKVVATKELLNLLRSSMISGAAEKMKGVLSDSDIKLLQSVAGLDAKSRAERDRILLNAGRALKNARSLQQKRLNEISAGLYREVTPVEEGDK